MAPTCSSMAGGSCDEGSEHVNAIPGERCGPHPRVYSDWMLGPGDPAFFAIPHSFDRYRTCICRTFALQYSHGVGLSIWKRPIVSRLVSFEHPEVFEPGMVFACETYWPASDGVSAARIEEEIVVPGGRPTTRTPRVRAGGITSRAGSGRARTRPRARASCPRSRSGVASSRRTRASRPRRARTARSRSERRGCPRG